MEFANRHRRVEPSVSRVTVPAALRTNAASARPARPLRAVASASQPLMVVPVLTFLARVRDPLQSNAVSPTPRALRPTARARASQPLLAPAGACRAMYGNPTPWRKPWFPRANLCIQCPGSSSVQCCLSTSCSTPSGTGTCRNTGNGCSGGSFVSGYCPGSSSVQCCVPTSSSSTCSTPVRCFSTSPFRVTTDVSL